MNATAKNPKALAALNAGLETQRQHAHGCHSQLPMTKTQRGLHDIMCVDKVEQARTGNTNAAREILMDYVQSVRRHTKRSWRGPNHFEYARYIAAALDAIVTDSKKDPGIALGIKAPKAGRRKGAVTHDAKTLAAAYWLLHRYGIKPEECISRISDVTGADRTTIQQARRAPLTAAFDQPNLVPDNRLKSILAKSKIGKKLLRLVREISSKPSQ